MNQTSPRCWKCGYDLTGLRVDDSCPECATEVWSSPTAAKPKDHAEMALFWAIGALALTCILGPLTVFFVVPVFREVRLARASVRAGRVSAQEIRAARFAQAIGFFVIAVIGFQSLVFARMLMEWFA